MSPAQLLIGVFLAVLLFSSMLWSLYRAVVTARYLRINAICGAAGVVTGMLGVTYSAPWLLMIAAPACLLFGLAQMMTDPGWSKLLPAIQFIFGIILINVLMIGSA